MVMYANEFKTKEKQKLKINCNIYTDYQWQGNLNFIDAKF